MNIEDLESKIWWSYLEEDLQELLKTAVLLAVEVSKWKQKFHDYSFIVFPASKAYEGFLKKLFLDMGFISEEEFLGRRFRIGKALNPSLNRSRYKRQSVYDKIEKFCGGKKLANTLWDTWKNCRNLLFHWFPNERKAISYDQAVQKIGQVVSSIDAAFEECKIGVK